MCQVHDAHKGLHDSMTRTYLQSLQVLDPQGCHAIQDTANSAHDTPQCVALELHLIAFLPGYIGSAHMSRQSHLTSEAQHPAGDQAGQ